VLPKARQLADWLNQYADWREGTGRKINERRKNGEAEFEEVG
jgi:hypothetical protein